ncbi:MAG: hypothetical protein ACLR1M_11985 [Oscillospiraceae bacterium]
MPLGGADAALYRSVREAVPIVDAAIGKLVRLSGGFRVLCEDERAQEELGEFLRTVNVGHAQVGFSAFLDKYLDSLLTNGRAVGEIVPDAEGREIAAVLCHRVEQLALREGETALDVRFCGYDAAGRLHELPRQELVLFTPLLPESENPYGVSLLRSMPFMAELLSRIYYAVGQNWERWWQRALRGGLQAAGRGAGRRAGARAGRAAGAGVVRRDAGDARRERARLCERGRREHPRHRRGQRDARL